MSILGAFNHIVDTTHSVSVCASVLCLISALLMQNDHWH